MIRGTAHRLFERLVASNTSFTGRLAAAILRRHYHWRLGLADADRRPNSDPLWQFLRDIFLDEEKTIDNAGTVLFQRRHFREIAARLQQLGHHVAPLDFDVDNKPLDRFVDLPPYLWEWTEEQKAFCGADVAHLKLWAEGFACTCFGLIIRKG